MLLEQLKRTRKAIADKQARQKSLFDEAFTKGASLSDEEDLEYKGLEADIAKLKIEAARIEELIEAGKSAQTTPVEGDSPEDSTKSNHPNHPNNTPRAQVVNTIGEGKGWAMAVKAQVLANRSGGAVTPIEVLKSWGAPKEVQNVLRAKAQIGTTTNPDFAAALVDAQVLQREFVEFLRPQTIVGRLNGFRKVPFNVAVPKQTGAGVVNWVGEGKVKPKTNPTFGSVTMGKSKIAGIAALTEELVRDASVDAIELVRNDLAADIATFTDVEFLDPTKAETDDSPASILYGVAPIQSTGVTPEAYARDLQAALVQLSLANGGVQGAYWLMSETKATELALLATDLGIKVFNGMELGADSRLLNLPVVVSDSVGDKIVIVRPTSILLADSGSVDFAYSDSATLTGFEGGTINMFEQNMIAVRAERHIRWKPVRQAAAWINYGEPVEEGAG